MARCVIIGAANIENYERAKSYLNEDDFCIFCDGGLKHQEALGIKPDLIIGDFDSYSKENALSQGIETIVLPCEKDDTDTVFAVKEGLGRGFSDFLLLGVIGQRLDHTLGNVSILLMLDGAGKCGTIVDDYSEMSIVGERPTYIEGSFSYFSVLNISGTAQGIRIEDAKYPLENAEIACDYQYGISNEVLPGGCAEVSVAEGSLLLIKVF